MKSKKQGKVVNLATKKTECDSIYLEFVRGLNLAQASSDKFNLSDDAIKLLRKHLEFNIWSDTKNFELGQIKLQMLTNENFENLYTEDFEYGFWLGLFNAKSTNKIN